MCGALALQSGECAYTSHHGEGTYPLEDGS